MKVLVKRITQGKQKGEFRFVLKADNHENLSPNETYKNKQGLMDTLEKYFPNFEIVDTTLKVPKVRKPRTKLGILNSTSTQTQSEE